MHFVVRVACVVRLKTIPVVMIIQGILVVFLEVFLFKKVLMRASEVVVIIQRSATYQLGLLVLLQWTVCFS